MKTIENHWIIALLMFAIGMIIKITLTILELISRTEPSPLSFVFVIIIAFSTGQLYAAKANKVMPKKTRLKASLIFAVYDTLYSLFIVLIIGVGQSLGFLKFIGFSLLGAIIFIPLMYLALGFGGRQMLRILEKRKAKQQKQKSKDY